MNAYEKWQVRVSIIQTVVLLATFLGALYIGLKQNEINQNLLELSHVVSVELSYAPQKLNIFNKGRENVWLWGTKFGDGPRTMEPNPRLVTPGGSYYLLTDKLEPEILQKVGQNGDDTKPLEIYIESQINKKYVVRNLLFIQVRTGAISIHSQTISIQEADWSK